MLTSFGITEGFELVNDLILCLFNISSYSFCKTK